MADLKPISTYSGAVKEVVNDDTALMGSLLLANNGELKSSGWIKVTASSNSYYLGPSSSSIFRADISANTTGMADNEVRFITVDMVVYIKVYTSSAVYSITMLSK